MITLKTLPNATEQEIFDQVARHLLTQNKRSEWVNPKTGNPSCSYRAGENNELMCAAGCLMSEDEAKMVQDKGMNQHGWEELVAEGFVGDEHIELIDGLQDIHDSALVSTWRHRLVALAGRHDLSPAVVEEHPYGNAV